jgi:hypothetical protein
MEDLAMAGERTPESWFGQGVVIWARAEGQPFEDTHGRIVPGYNQAMGEFSGRLEGVNELGATLATENGQLAFFPWASVARIVLATQ